MPELIGAAAPYPGLRPFEPHESEIFFGREAHTDRLLEILQREHMLAVIGPSGSGKSSLVRAGLLPSLRIGALGSGSDWRIAVLRPGDQPFRSLASALLESNVFEPELIGSATSAGATVEDVALLTAELRRGPLGLLHATANARASHDRPGASAANLLIVVDQFEEIFTYADASDDRADDSEAFVNLLLTARRDPGARVHVVLTMRTDFLGNCVRFADLPETINRTQYLTPRLTRAEIGRAIAGPAEVFGGSVDPSLVAEMINATGQNSDQLPLLQHALARMWARASTRNPESPSIGWDDATAIGGLAGALNQHAESVLADLLARVGPSGETHTAALFCAITERRTASGGGQDVRRPQTLARIAAAAGVEDWKELATIVRAYSAPDVSLLQHGRTLDETSVVDLSHEALMRQWARLSRWVNTEARRSSDYRRWAERAVDHVNERGNLLEGAALARATEWLTGDDAASAHGWRPTAAWAARYAVTDNSAAEFNQTVAFIEESATHARKRQQEEHDRQERERLEAIERAQAAEREVKQARMRILIMGALLIALVVVAGAAYRYYQRANDSAKKAQDLAVLNQELADKLAAELNKASAQLSIAESSSLYGEKQAGAGPRSISMAELAAIMPASSEQRRAVFLEPLNAAMADAAIDTPLRQAHFLGQASYESSDLRLIEEKWGPTEGQQRYEPPSAFAKSIGNVEPGDGQRYRGRGLFLLLGRDNYTRVGAALGLDLVGQPELAVRPDIAVRTATLFWKLTRLNELAEADDIRGITRKISGGLNGLDGRTRAVERAKLVLGVRPAVMGQLELAVNRQGLDFDAVGRVTENAETCAELCRRERDCRSMTFVISRRTCWLKTGVPPALPPGGPDYVSAVKQ